jgi:GR25 family glycosyltransferase involved in LPS biosynthesis
MAPKMKKTAKKKVAKVKVVLKKKSMAKKTIKASMAAKMRKGFDPSSDDKLMSLHAYVINLERRPDRWSRVSEMLTKETPWLNYEKFAASDGTQNPIPEEEVTSTWNTSCNAQFADYFEWVFVAPGKPIDGTRWKWSCDADSDAEWKYTEKKHKGSEFSYIHHAWEKEVVRTATVTKVATKETFKLRLQLSPQCLNPGMDQRMSGGERGCAHSHLRLWRVAAERSLPTLVLEDDVQMVFDRTNHKLGKSNGSVFSQRLAQTLRLAPQDYDVIYLGWSGWRGGNSRTGKKDVTKDAPWNEERNQFLRKAQYVWTTVAYVITQQGAKKLLAAARPLNQPVDNFMAWEASQGRLNAFVALDAGDNDGTWAGGIVDQADFQGDSDITKSDGGVQGDDMADFAVA